ncbi:MAG: hypothetical protein J6J38_02035 [Lachnospiraceae bacterium]|nr:hypothetical protein [Lachnospiraceae bacterium]
MKKQTRAIVFFFIIGVLALVTVSCSGNQTKGIEVWNDAESTVSEERLPEITMTPTPIPTPMSTPAPTPAMFEHKLVAHALGGIDGYTYLNSKEGCEDSYSKGMRFIETDLFLSADGALICSHGFKKADVERMGIAELTVGTPPESAVWDKMRFFETYSTADGDDILYYLETYPELYFEFDMRSLKGEDAYRMARAVVDKFGKDSEIFQRILIQVYSIEMYEIFKEVYDFPVIQFYLTESYCKEIDTYIDFCKSHDIVSVAVSDSYVTDEILDKLRNSGIKILVHTIDDVQKAEDYLEKGVTVICTNHLYMEADGTIRSKLD